MPYYSALSSINYFICYALVVQVNCEPQPISVSDSNFQNSNAVDMYSKERS